MPEYDIREIQKRWNENADAYANRHGPEGDENKSLLVTPTVQRLLRDLELDGKMVLDAACGEGYLSRWMSAIGAQVMAIDLSQRMLENARRRTPSEMDISYQWGNLEDLSDLKDEKFDLAVSILALQDTPRHDLVIHELHRVLKPSSKCILAFLHPCFSSDGAWVEDDQGKKLYWKIDNYFREAPAELRLYPEIENPPIYFHRTLSNYFRTFRDGGFDILDLIEPTPDEDSLKKYPAYIDDYRMTSFIIFVLQKTLK